MIRLHITTLTLAVILVITGCASDKEANLFKKASRIHSEVFTIDTHTDTPMRFGSDNYDFGRKNDPYENGSKVDLPRMEEGRLDAIFLAAFLGQRERSEEGNLRAKESAERIIERIHETVERYPDQAKVAYKPSEVHELEKAGIKSIFIGMENGYPIGQWTYWNEDGSVKEVKTVDGPWGREK